ncbi:hypothetical protein FB45DRAFT_753433, partial [Roridomyces roridus]
PTEADISPLNAEINQNIAVLRQKYLCHDNDGSDHCWVNPEGKHIHLNFSHFNKWAACLVRRPPNGCDLNTPPNHALFDPKANANHLARPSLLQQRIANEKNAGGAGTGPVINFSLDGLAEILRPHAPAPAASSAPASATQDIADHSMLLPAKTKCGETMSVDAFCGQFHLDDFIAQKFAENRYKTTVSFLYVRLDDLEKMGFAPGDIAELREAVRRWAVAL